MAGRPDGDLSKSVSLSLSRSSKLLRVQLMRREFSAYYSAPTIQRLLEGIENEMPDEGPYRQFIVNGQYAAVIQLII